MIWLIIGIILFAITLYVHKHTYKRAWGKYEDRLPCPLWLVILIFCIAFTPYLGVVAFLIGLVIYILEATEGAYPDICFKPKGIVKKVIDLSTKEV